ncbi:MULTISPECIES: CBO0543 family protein [Caldibacillus]|uniref:CBO0543 family protein n=1 Tax=Bacillaceae TaxID=186817 RepID=UPI00069807BD
MDILVFLSKKRKYPPSFICRCFCYADFCNPCYIGSALGLWYYTGKLTPSIPAWFPYNLCLLPVSVMFLIQAKPHIASWKKGVFYGLLTAFVGEPFFVWTGYYVMTGWEYIYSVPIYAIIFIFCDWLTKRDSFERVYK